MRKVRRAGPCQQDSRSGFSLLEVMLTVAIFGITMAGLTSSQLTSIALSRANRDQAAAMDAAQAVLEAIQDEDEFSEIFARWNANALDNPAAGDSPGNTFEVRGLEPLNDDPDGFVGEVIFPGDGTKLLENVRDRLLGMPRDLDLSGLPVDNADHSDDYRVLPVMVRVRWRGPSGPMQVQLVTTLAQR